MKTQGELIDNVLKRLSDTAEQVWTRPEIARYGNEGLRRLSSDTLCVWDTLFLEDSATTGNYTCDAELQYMDGGDVICAQFSYTAPSDADYLDPGQLDLGPTNHTHLWETAYLTETYFRAVYQLPEDLAELERATWDYKRIEALRSSELESADSRYQINNGEVLGYLRDKDGWRSFRKWRVPAAAADSFTITGYLGLIRTPTDVSAETVLGSWGVCRRLPTMHPTRSAQGFGFPRRPFKDIRNTKVEHSRHATELENDDSVFEIPERYVKYVRNFVLFRCYERNGLGQDLQLSSFFKQRYDEGVLRIKARMKALNAYRRNIVGETQQSDGRPPRARLPWQYGRVVD